MVSTINQLRDIVNELKDNNAVDAAAVVRRDGVLMASNFPKYTLGWEVFAMMSATIHGAAKNISSKSAMGLPSKIVIETPEGNIIIATAGSKALLVCLIKDGIDSQTLSEALKAAEEKVDGVL